MLKKLAVMFTAASMLAASMPAVLADTAEQTPEPPADMQSVQPAGASASKAMPFLDVTSDKWYYNIVARAYSMGLIEGMTDEEFAPESQVTGAQLVTMLYRLDGNKLSENYDGDWYDEPVLWAVDNGMLRDNLGGTFEANEALKREQMMVLLYRYMLTQDVDLESEADLSQFTDNEELSVYALDAAAKLVAAGLIEGDGETLRPSAALSRAEAATILVNSVDKLGLSTGAAPAGNAPRGTPPADIQSGAPGGTQPVGTPPADMQGGAPNGIQPQGTPPADMPGGAPGGNAPGGFGGSGTVTQGTAATTIDEDGTYSNKSYTSTGDDENALRIDGSTVTLESITVDKSAGASSNTEDGDFYGQNAALLATNGADVTIKNAKVTSSAQNGNGVFSYGEGTKVTISDSEITTTADNSGGIQTTGGGATYADNLTINTNGQSAAAIRSDRGGGTVVVDEGSYTSNGYNSPAVYSTADITVSNAELTANNSEALVIEGKNSITLENCDVYGNMSDTKGSSSDENVHNVMIYQSMSGDADVGTSTFSMTGGTLKGNNGDMIYVTNTHSVITLSGVSITNNDKDAYLLNICGNSASHGWGTAGANGAQVELTANAQTLEGDIVVDSISTLDLSLTNKSSFTGTINITENAQNGTAVDNNAVVTIDAGSTWTLTGDCTITSIENKGKINFNGHTITLADGTVMKK